LPQSTHRIQSPGCVRNDALHSGIYSAFCSEKLAIIVAVS